MSTLRIRQTEEATFNGRSQTKWMTQQQNIMLLASTDRCPTIWPTVTAWLEKFHIDNDSVLV